ncbi:hypothetical protein FRC01_012004, partial [Tulasnella sp. 417]
ASPGNSWRALPDDQDDNAAAAAATADDFPLEPPQPAFVVREERASTPRSSRSRISESESIWLRGSTLPPPAASGSGERSSQQRSTWYSEDYDAETPGTPKFAAKIVEARQVSVRPHWSTAFIYHPSRLPSGDDLPEQTGSSSNVPFPIAPSPLNQLANHAKEKEAQFEADFRTGLTRQIYVSERRVSRAPGGTSLEHDADEEDVDPYITGSSAVAQQGSAPAQPPRLSDRAADMERRRRSPKVSIEFRRESELAEEDVSPVQEHAVRRRRRHDRRSQRGQHGRSSQPRSRVRHPRLSEADRPVEQRRAGERHAGARTGGHAVDEPEYAAAGVWTTLQF